MTLSPQPLEGLKKILLLVTGSSLITLVLILLTIDQTSDRVWHFLENWLQPQSTNLEVTDSVLLLKQIQHLQELTTTVYRMETIVPTAAERTFGKDWTIATTKLLYLARGEVRAGIDLSEITINDVKVDEEKIAIALPPAAILDSKIDLHNSQVYHYDRGFLNLGPDVAPQLQTLAQQKTLAKIVTTACNEGILNTANQQAQQTISQFLQVTHHKTIEVKIDNSPQTCEQSVLDN